MSNVEIGLADGTKLVLADNNLREDDVLKRLQQAAGSRPDGSPLTAFAAFDTTEGTYRVNPAHVVYVRTIG